MKVKEHQRYMETWILSRVLEGERKCDRGNIWINNGQKLLKLMKDAV